MAQEHIYGLGGEEFGDPISSGGTVQVNSARCIEGQTVRVTFSEAPLHESGAGYNDAWNPSNYTIEIVSGAGTQPQVVGVKQVLVIPQLFTITGATNASPIVIEITTDTDRESLPNWPDGTAITVQDVEGNEAANGYWIVTQIDQDHWELNSSTGDGSFTSGGTACLAERSIDIQTDRELVKALTYRVTANNIRSAYSTMGMGAPYSADFVGIIKYKIVNAPKTYAGLIDIASDPVTGGWVVDGSGDVAIQDALAGLKKRIVRRIMTPKNSYSFLTNYGVTVELKKPMSVVMMGALKSDIYLQVKQEPEVDDLAINMQFSGGVLTINMAVKTKKGSGIEVSLTASESGGVVVN